MPFQRRRGRQAAVLTRHPLYGLAAILWARETVRIERLLPPFEAGLVWGDTPVRERVVPSRSAASSSPGRAAKVAAHRSNSSPTRDASFNTWRNDIMSNDTALIEVLAQACERLKGL